MMPAARTSPDPARPPAPPGSAAAPDAVLEELTPRRLRRRLLQMAALVAVVALVVAGGPSLGSLRSRLSHASPGWLMAAVGFEVLSVMAYVVIFRAVFCPRMSWRLSYQIAMSEQGANSVLSVSGAGGLALGAWALRTGGMSVEFIGRRTVAFFFLTSLANVIVLAVFAAGYAVGVLHGDSDPTLTYGFGAAALAAIVLVLALPAVLRSPASTATPDPSAGRLARVAQFIRSSLVQGIRDARALLWGRSPGVLVGSLGTMGFDLAVLWASFRGVGLDPPVGVVVLGYLIGQLGGNLPVPGGIGGLDAGLIGVFVLYHQPLAATSAAVLIYHGISLWVPALLGSVAFVRLRGTLRRETRPAAICAPLAEPIEVVRIARPGS